jgi:signal peptidase I
MTTILNGGPTWSPRWQAALMSLLLPGWGQLRNGQLNRAIWQFLAFALLCVPGLALVALHLPDALMVPMLLLALLATLGLWLGSAVDAWRGAAQTERKPRQPWQLSGVQALVFVLCDLVALPLLTLQVRAHQVEPFRIPSASMAPTLLPGDFVFADKRYNCPGAGCKGRVQRGDVAIFVYPNDRTLYYVKRIVGLPGDHVTLQDGVLAVNGQPVPDRSQPQPVAAAASPASPASVLPLPPKPDRLDLIVPPGQVYVLGDQRTQSVDSRQFGSVPLADVVGRVWQIWFSWGEGGVRWSRLGRVPD